jgi:arginine dihydrolase
VIARGRVQNAAVPLYRSLGELDFRLDDLPRLGRPARVLMADPRHFQAETALNPHMLDERGRLKRVDRELAREQWLELKRAFERCGLAVDVLAPLEGQPDLVFCANQVLPIPADAARDGRARIVPSNMAHPERRGEVPHVVAALAAQGYLVEPLERRAKPEGPAKLEGTGDGLWHPGRRLLWAGCGERSSEEAWAELAERYDLAVVLLRLVDPAFYHLDTCLALLSEMACLWLPSALAPESRELLRALFATRVEADERESRERLACNAFCPDARRVLLQRGCNVTAARLRAAGFEPVEVETGEFLKSGGSVFCLKLCHGGAPKP